MFKFKITLKRLPCNFFATAIYGRQTSKNYSTNNNGANNSHFIRLFFIAMAVYYADDLLFFQSTLGTKVY